MLRRLALVALVSVALVACSGDDDEVVTDTTTTTTTPPQPPTAAVDWAARTIAIDGDVPFDVNFCAGDAPMLCITDDGVALGSIELATFAGQAVADFDAWAADFYTSIGTDRSTTCPDYVLDGDDPTPAPFAGLAGSVRYGFTGTVGGTVVERVVGYAGNDDAGALRLLVANALADDSTQSCLHRESELPVDVMDELEPVLAALAAGSALG